MNHTASTDLVRYIMMEFAGLTGLEPPAAHPERYLWTDAFAVCAYLELFRRTNDETCLDLALRLVDQVHHTLGRHRDDDVRYGWISGFSEQEGALHPTAGGLRIGKPINERNAAEPLDEEAEWDRDGQYYHYLTKWMHALSRVAAVTRNPTYLEWAMELAQVAHAAFTYVPLSAGRKRMYWKMSIDLARPLVPSMGLHDPLDGLVTYAELQAAARHVEGSVRLDLSHQRSDAAAMCRGMSFATDDPLGTGGLLFDARRIVQLLREGVVFDEVLLASVMDAALFGLESFVASNTAALPAEVRLAFRELGLAIGLKGAGALQREIAEHRDVSGGNDSLQQRAEALLGYVPFGDAIDRFWMDERNRKAGTWIEHREINMVMLATSLAPGEFLEV
jgi:hypothetical protein